MSEPIELTLNSNKQLLRLYCGKCGDSKDIVLESNTLDLCESQLSKIEYAIEGMLIDFAHKVGTEEAESSRVRADKIVKEVMLRLKNSAKINVTIQDSVDLDQEDEREHLLSPVEIIV